MNRTLKLYSLISIGLFLLISGATAQDQFKFGVVDTQKVLENYKKAQEANEVLKTAENKLKSQLGKMIEEIQTMEERLTKQKLFLDDPQTANLENDIRLKKEEYQRELEAGQDSIMDKQKELIEPILAEIEALIKQVGEKEGYSLILEKRLVTLYVNAKYDLTDTILNSLNKQYEQSASKSSQNDSKQSATSQ